MRLNEKLKNCLLDLASRYPMSLVDINQELPDQHDLLVEAWLPPCSLERLRSHASEQ